MLLSGEGGASEWYYNLIRAPWEPSGWVFGAAWTTIMICLAFYMSISWNYVYKKKLILLYIAQLILNIFILASHFIDIFTSIFLLHDFKIYTFFDN